MDLVSGTPLWPAIDPAELAPEPLTRTIGCDVAIVGAGITGALVAWKLAGTGADVVVVDRRPPGLGSTGACTALVLYETDLTLAELARAHGLERAMRAYRRCVEAVEEIGRVVGALGDACGYRPCASLYLASSAADARSLPDECRLRRDAGIDVELLDAKALEGEYGLRRPGALRSRTAAELDPYRFTQRLLVRSLAVGTRIFSGEVVTLERRADGVTLATADGHRIVARHAVLATGYEAEAHLPRPVARLRTTYTIATAPGTAPGHTGGAAADGAKGAGPPAGNDAVVLWETARPYLYARTTADGRLLVGGEDDACDDPAERGRRLPDKRRRLEARADALWAESLGDRRLRAEYAWAGAFAETEDGLPYIGAAPGFAHATYALGYGVNGITFGVVAADILRDLALGRAPCDADLFAFDRPTAS
jgi:glycine/D-amino acid oxidase-like deaminating enzyme